MSLSNCRFKILNIKHILIMIVSPKNLSNSHKSTFKFYLIISVNYNFLYPYNKATMLIVKLTLAKV